MKKLFLIALTAALAMPSAANAAIITANSVTVVAPAKNILLGTTWTGGAVPIASNDYTVDFNQIKGHGSTATADVFAGDSLTLLSGGQLWSGAANAHVQFVGDLNINAGGAVRGANNGAFRINVLGDINVADGARIDGGNNTAQDVLFTGGKVKGTGTFNIDSVTSNRDGGVTFQAGVDWTDFTGTLLVTPRGDLNFAFGGAIAVPEAEGNFDLEIQGTAANGYRNTKDIFVTGLTVDGTVYGDGVYTSAFLSGAHGAINNGGGTITVVSVPEPSSLALLAIGSSALFFRRKK